MHDVGDNFELDTIDKSVHHGHMSGCCGQMDVREALSRFS